MLFRVFIQFFFALEGELETQTAGIKRDVSNREEKNNNNNSE
jgi:hypothetical protein